ncbi:helix-turn-helix transcriptional regulator [Dactylosporangium fulvum]|uniref:Helix-turn-helix transcriptional regulator n=1 Tax=Dactylosporangium fulvum TaxID=53359 RepID=A0ABY5W574_9ACTN|nr:helix-turn-helix transcriptional regulator [Dactylosporangium fulvum]UWP84164.1 helix-turn-helix transcriptional regulator [Dactylosporangium fulvum]
MNRGQLAEFLKGRRARVRPADVGLPAGPRRRTPGLRREEVARLAGISVDYYARLEQGRGPRPSRQVLAALGRALRLFDDERTYLFQLAGEQPGPPAGPSQTVSAGIRHLLERLDDTPAFVIDAKYELLAWNRMAVRLMGDPDAHGRNLIWNAFCGPFPLDAASPPESQTFADECVADLRAASARYPSDPGIQDLIARLTEHSPEFVRRWNEHRVCVRRTTTKTLHHPHFGELVLECQVLHADEQGQRVVFYTAAPGSPTASVLCGLREAVVA